MIRPFIFLLLLSLAVCLTGCPSGGTTPQDSGDSSGHSSDTASSKDCADKLATALNSLDPMRLEIDAEIEDTTNAVNDWFVSCGVPPELSAEDRKFFEKFLSEDELRYFEAEQFVSRDTSQIRTNLLLGTMAEKAVAGAGSDLERVLRLFEYVTRNVVLQPDNQDLPLTLYEVVLFGRGTAEHQAWVFAELLHQLRIDAVILTSRGNETTGEWICAVCLPEGNYLFDFSLQTPVPADKNERAWPISRPATLKEVIAAPELIDNLKQQGSQVPSGEALKTPQVWIPSDTSYWTPRIMAISKALSGESVLVADPLLDGENSQGLLSRLDDASDLWKRSDIRPWAFPAEQQRGYWSISENSSQGGILRARRMPFYARMSFSVNEQTGAISIQERTNEQWKARLNQLSGKYQGAISAFGSLRLGSPGTKTILQGQSDNPRLQIFLQGEDAAAEDAHFWVGVSQLELERYSDAGVTFNDYLSKYPNSDWTDAVYVMLATIELKRDDPEGAVEQLKQVPSNSLLRHPADFIRSRIGPAEEPVSPAASEGSESNKTSSSE